MRSEKQNDTRYLHSPLRTPKVTNATFSASTYIKICSHMMRTVHLCASVAPVRGHNQIGLIFSAESLLPLHLLNDNTGLMCLTFTDDLYRRSVRLVSRRKNVRFAQSQKVKTRRCRSATTRSTMNFSGVCIIRHLPSHTPLVRPNFIKCYLDCMNRIIGPTCWAIVA